MKTAFKVIMIVSNVLLVVVIILGIYAPEVFSYIAKPFARKPTSEEALKLRGSISITLDKSVHKIEDGAYKYYYSLKNFTSEGKIMSIGNEAFYGCSSLQLMSIPDTVESMGESVFEGCSSLKAVSFGKGITCIPVSTCESCSSLEVIYIPSSILEIKKDAFNYCYELRRIIFDGTCEQWKSIKKENGWNYIYVIKTVECRDGIIQIG